MNDAPDSGTAAPNLPATISPTANLPAQLANWLVTQTPQAELVAAIKENIGAQLNAFDLDRIPIPAGGGQAWSIPTIEGKPQVTDALECVILHFNDVRAYWEQDFETSGGGVPPDCASTDTFVGDGKPGGNCLVCPFAKFGSAQNKDGTAADGQACKYIRRLFIMLPNRMLPLLISAPPTSLTPLKKFFVGLAGQGMRYRGVKAKLELEQDKSATGVKFSKIKPSFVARISDAEFALMESLHRNIAPALDATLIGEADYRAAPQQ